jgi:radical SAM superfamily enzyme YgiQ (UPF0313 family)
MLANKLRVVILKPSKYAVDGYVERFRRGFMPNSTIPYIQSMTPQSLEGRPIETFVIDEYVQTRLQYLDLLDGSEQPTLLALVGVQSHQFHRALDLAAFARARGAHCVVGGPHPMTCDTRMLQGNGVSFALAEAELVWTQILEDAIRGELKPVYGESQRWQSQLAAPVLIPPSRQDLKRYVIPMLGFYPARGCPFTCNFCSVIKIAGRQIRGQSIDTTLAGLREAKRVGVRLVMFTSDNFNKYPDAKELLRAMIEEKIKLPFFAQCDTQIAQQEELVELLARAGCCQLLTGVESFSRQVLLAAHKTQNRPALYKGIVTLCRRYGITSHFTNIIGFPQDTESGVQSHLEALRLVDSDIASFYILTPIPGTEQYDDFLAKGWVTERNLDRFDGISTTWTHPVLSSRQLVDLLFLCYRKFYTASHMLRASLQSFSRRYAFVGLRMGLGVQAFMRFSSAMRLHPMSGGIRRVRLDRVSDYLDGRKTTYGFELAPLPHSLVLSAADAALNAHVKLKI